ncbi:MAG: efflux RND transporter periplasmic adaptor subunit [Rudaea sp.]
MKTSFRRSRIAIIATMTLLGACSSENNSPPPAANTAPANFTLTPAQRQHIHLYTVATTPYHKVVDATGVVDFDNDQATSVLAPFSGPVSRLLVAPGDRVKKGDPLAAVESPDFATTVGAYRKALSTARTNRKLAEIDKDLVQHSGIAQKEATQAESDAANAEADRDAALQALVAMKLDPQAIKDIEAGKTPTHVDGTIRAPIAGTVVEKLITPGQLLQAGTTPCFTIADLSRVWVMAQVFGSNLESVALGDEADIVTGIGANKFSGKVDNIAALVDPATRSVAVRIVVDNPGDFLKKQMYVHVLIHDHRESSGLLVPVSAILRDDENLPFVYIVKPDNSFARQHVTLGYRYDDRYDITDGLQPGQQIVVDGAIFMQFMQNQ